MTVSGIHDRPMWPLPAQAKAGVEGTTVGTEEMDRTEVSEEAVALSQDYLIARQFSAADLETVKARFKELMARRSDVNTSIQAIIDDNNLAINPFDRVKVEISSDGRAMVGGLTDTVTAKKLENLINRDQGLVRQIAEYQAMEDEVSRSLYSLTGLSLRQSVEQLQGWSDDNRVAAEAGGMEKALHNALRDLAPELYDADQELLLLVGDFVTGRNIDVSGFSPVFEQAASVVDNTVEAIMHEVADAFKRKNEATIACYGPTISQEELDKLMLSLHDLTVHVDHLGNLTMEGSAAEDRSMDKEGQQIVRDIFEARLEADPMAENKSDFTLAAYYLLGQYDFIFDAGDSERTVEVTFRKGQVESHIKSPVQEAEIRQAIPDAARKALTEMGIDASGVYFEVDDDGILTASNAAGDPVLAAALNVLNAELENRHQEEFDPAARHSDDPVERLRALLVQLDVYRPGGTQALVSITTIPGWGE